MGSEMCIRDSDNSLEALILLSTNVTALLLMNVLFLPAYEKFPLNTPIFTFSIFSLCNLKFPLVFIIPPIQLFEPDRNNMRYDLEFVTNLLELIESPPLMEGKKFKRL